ncbi:MAG: nicotinate-nucleotide adenylyltransferase [Candidatus Abyssubacteria bacterium]
MKLGIMGGTFDPIHIGHLIIAEEARWQCGLDTVLFIVTRQPPHKKAPEAGAEDRFKMVELATGAVQGFRPSRIEIERGGNSYTAETLRELKRIHPDAAMYLIVGSDSVIDFSDWKNPDAVIEMAEVVVAPRPGFDLAQMEPRLRGKARVLDAPTFSISSTMLRERLHNGKPIRFLVPEPVERYIQERRLYIG